MNFLTFLGIAGLVWLVLVILPKIIFRPPRLIDRENAEPGSGKPTKKRYTKGIEIWIYEDGPGRKGSRRARRERRKKRNEKREWEKWKQWLDDENKKKR